MIIRTHDLSKKFAGNLVVDSLNFEVPEGGVYALVGPNGAGKSTTIKLLMNIHSPTRGRSEVLGTDSRHLAPREFARIGYVSEDTELPGWMTVEYFLDYLKPFYPTWDGTVAAELLRIFDLPRGRRIRDLSRGMKMKAALASSLAYHPALIVLDEPFTGLDALVRDELIEALLAAASESTILISSHDLSEIESFASHIGYLDRGKLHFSEEMTSLTGRFREVEIQFDAPPAMPSPWPVAWLKPEISAAQVRFVETQFAEERTASEIRALFPHARNLTFTPMPLRSIFVSLAKASREAA